MQEFIELLGILADLIPWWGYFVVYGIALYTYADADADDRKILKRAGLIAILVPLIWMIIAHFFIIDKAIEGVKKNGVGEWLFYVGEKIYNFFAPLFLICFLSAVGHIYLKVKENLEYDPWLPEHFSPQISPALRLAMHADLETADIDQVISGLNRGLEDLHTQKQRAEAQLQKWRSVPPASDEEFEGVDGKGRTLRGRTAKYSRYEIAGFQSDLLDTIGALEEAIKLVNKRQNHILEYAPKLKGITRPKTMNNIEGLTVVPFKGFGQIEANKTKKIEK